MLNCFRIHLLGMVWTNLVQALSVLSPLPHSHKLQSPVMRWNYFGKDRKPSKTLPSRRQLRLKPRQA